MNLFNLQHGYYVRAAEGYPTGGDAAIVYESSSHWFYVVIDVLGHGFEATYERARIEASITQYLYTDLQQSIDDINSRFADSRGFALGILTIEKSSGWAEYVSIGNTVCRIISDKEEKFYSNDGIVGQYKRSINIQKHKMPQEGFVFLYSDGVSESAPLSIHSHLFLQSPTKIAKTIVEDLGKPYDDACCIVIKLG
ncbi:MAG: SpoIIE family protein phosphatase [Pseudomonadota bacterium]